MTLAAATRYAGFWRRAAASFIDSLLFGLVLAVIYLLLGWGLPGAAAPAAANPVAEFALGNLLPVALTVFLWVRFLGTPGKRLLGYEVVDADSGAALRIGQALPRYLGYFVSLLPFGLGFLWIAWDRRKQGFHDKIAKTVVVLEDPAREPLPDLERELR